jgi:hypothetical protein
MRATWRLLAARREGVRCASSDTSWAIWFTLLQEDEGQIEAAGGQEGRGQVCQLILQLSQLQHVLGQGVLQHIHVASLHDKLIETNDDI